MLISALLFCLKLKEDLKEIRFKFNLHDVCVGNCMIEEKQHMVRFHVDDLMSSHENSKVNDDFHDWLNKMHGEFGEVTTTRGDKHTHLRMDVTFLRDEEGSVQVSMVRCIEEMLKDFPIKFKSKGNTRFRHHRLCSMTTQVRN